MQPLTYNAITLYQKNIPQSIKIAISSQNPERGQKAYDRHPPFPHPILAKKTENHYNVVVRY